mmetsp:Transcript_48570/g.104074  ORF Transcript_48570/g.104074 Transcript_48570/m.104074 type:complete len:291 (+) Transcript_48570:835-1707(+)
MALETVLASASFHVPEADDAVLSAAQGPSPLLGSLGRLARCLLLGEGLEGRHPDGRVPRDRRIHSRGLGDRRLCCGRRVSLIRLRIGRDRHHLLCFQGLLLQVGLCWALIFDSLLLDLRFRNLHAGRLSWLLRLLLRLCLRRLLVVLLLLLLLHNHILYRLLLLCHILCAFFAFLDILSLLLLFLPTVLLILVLFVLLAMPFQLALPFCQLLLALQLCLDHVLDMRRHLLLVKLERPIFQAQDLLQLLAQNSDGGRPEVFALEERRDLGSHPCGGKASDILCILLIRHFS